MDKKWIYFFGEKEAGKDKKNILGGKGANLSEMTKIGIPVPPGFTITAEVCKAYYENNEQYPEGVMDQVNKNLKRLEEKMGKEFGDKEDPLLVSVRSGAAVSMPGMMDTVLNLGLNDETVQGLIKQTNNERFGWDSYRRFIQMFGDVVMGVERDKFENAIQKKKDEKDVDNDIDLTKEDLKDLVETFKKIYKEGTGEDFPQDPKIQLKKSMDAVFGSWNNERAIKYRRINEITGLLGTAVNIQTMVFGNMGDNSGTGVAFTRNPSTGENKLYGEYLLNAQGEDVVAGIRTPHQIEDLEEQIPNVYKELLEIRNKLEKHYKDVQDLEFTIQDGKLYILQTRTGKRTGVAAVKIAVDMANEGLIDEKTAVLRVEPKQLNQLLHKRIDPHEKEQNDVLAKGLPASPGAAVGQVVFTADEAAEWDNQDKKVVLVRKETSPEDIEGMDAAQGILTSRGGITSHAAVVARGMGKCCVAGAGDIVIDEKEKQFKVGNNVVKEGDWVTLDGTAGEVYLDKLGVVEPKLAGTFATLMKWADKYRILKIKTNADTPEDAKKALQFGAEGIGLTRTEHMFFEPDRIKAMREMILAEDKKGREKALKKLEPMQKEDFKGILKAMDGKPVIIRLLDPPLHEFLPKGEKEIKELAEDMNVDIKKVKDTISSLHEVNPMLGFRGCRLGVQYPEINEMQARAIFKAAVELKEEGLNPIPQIEVPLAGNVKEFNMIKKIIEKVARETGAKEKVKYQVGTMIEIPRAAITADEIAKKADFMSFGTNDLTQMTCGFSRDDAGKFLEKYKEEEIYERDPFQSIDQQGVGKLMQLCVKKAREAEPNMEIGICGEHGGEPESVKFCHKIGLDDVSCSPFRVPIARLAAAQAAIEEE